MASGNGLRFSSLVLLSTVLFTALIFQTTGEFVIVRLFTCCACCFVIYIVMPYGVKSNAVDVLSINCKTWFYADASRVCSMWVLLVYTSLCHVLPCTFRVAPSHVCSMEIYEKLSDHVWNVWLNTVCTMHTHVRNARTVVRLYRKSWSCRPSTEVFQHVHCHKSWRAHWPRICSAGTWRSRTKRRNRSCVWQRILRTFWSLYAQ